MTTISPKILVFISINCDFCGKPSSDDGAMTFPLYHLFGWVICDNCDCNKQLKQSIVKYYNDIQRIPLAFYTKQDTVPLSFYRKRTNSITSSTNKLNYNFFADTQFEIHTNKNKLHMALSFIDDVNGEMNRAVSLTNIFFHNPEFYDVIVNATNLKNSADINMAFGYTDLSDDIKTLLKASYDEANSLPKDHVFDN